MIGERQEAIDDIVALNSVKTTVPVSTVMHHKAEQSYESQGSSHTESQMA